MVVPFQHEPADQRMGEDSRQGEQEENGQDVEHCCVGDVGEG